MPAVSKSRALVLAMLIGFIICICAVDVAGAQHSEHNAAAENHAEFNAERAFKASQQAIGRKLSNHLFTNSHGKAVGLDDLLGRPVVISMIYTSCHHVCPTLTNHLASVVDIGREALGEKAFSVLTVGFDTAVDNPQQMAMFAAQRGIDQANWRFVSADEQTISTLSDELGFLYEVSPRGFDHITQTTVVDRTGVIRNQVYGIDFDAPLLVEALKHILRDEVFERDTVEGWWRSVKLLCTVYDPATGRYHFDYSLIVAFVMGFTALLAVAVFVVRAWRSSRRFGLTS